MFYQHVDLQSVLHFLHQLLMYDFQLVTNVHSLQSEEIKVLSLRHRGLSFLSLRLIFHKTISYEWIMSNMQNCMNIAKWCRWLKVIDSTGRVHFTSF